MEVTEKDEAFGYFAGAVDVEGEAGAGEAELEAVRRWALLPPHSDMKESTTYGRTRRGISKTGVQARQWQGPGGASYLSWGGPWRAHSNWGDARRSVAGSMSVLGVWWARGGDL